MPDKINIEPRSSDKWLSKLTAAHIQKSGVLKDDLEDIIRLFFRRANDRYLRTIADDHELDTIAGFVNFTTMRKEGEIKVRILEAADVQKGLAEGMIALETCMADQRFIVDTIKLCIAETRVREEGSVHFTIPIHRDDAGKLAMAFFKLYCHEELLQMDVSRFPLKDKFLKGYFPKLIYDSYYEDMSSHMLLRELLVTLWMGHTINDAGASIFTDLIMDSERSVQDVAFAYTATNGWMNGDDVKQRIMSCDEIPLTTRFRGLEAIEEGVKGATSWILQFFPGETLYERIGDGQDFNSTAKEYRAAFECVMEILLSDSSSVSAQLLIGDIKKYEKVKFPHDIAQEIAASTRWSIVFPVAHLANKTGKPAKEAAQAYLDCGQVTGMLGILSRTAVQSSADRWEVQALRSLRASLRRTLLLLSERVLEAGSNEALKRDPSISQVGTEIAKLHANPNDPVPISFLVVMGEKLHKAVTRGFETPTVKEPEKEKNSSQDPTSMEGENSENLSEKAGIK